MRHKHSIHAKRFIVNKNSTLKESDSTLTNDIKTDKKDYKEVSEEKNRDRTIENIYRIIWDAFH